MAKRKKKQLTYVLVKLLCAPLCLGLLDSSAAATLKCAAPNTPGVHVANSTLTEDSIIKQLGWVSSNTNICGGYYLEPAYNYPDSLAKKNLVQYTSTGPTLFALHGTSSMSGNVTVTQKGQQVIANKAYLYRDPGTNKLSAIDLAGDVHFREPGSLVVAKTAHLNLKDKSQQLRDITYRTTIYSNKHVRPAAPTLDEIHKPREIVQLNAWGKAKEFNKDQPRIFHFKQVTYTTCPPDTSVWSLDASTIDLDRNTGRGTATNARLYIKSVPIFYSPYVSFPIDNRRQSGFLAPMAGSSGKAGPYLGTPYYWNIAPNYDDTFTPSYLSKRGWEFTDLFRYLTARDSGKLNISVTPDDKAFSHLQTTLQENFGANPDPATQANLNHVENAGQTRGVINWLNNTRFNDHWFSDIDYTRVSDDYYLEDYGHTLANEVTQNQLLQQGNVSYRGQNWNFVGRLQQYQTLHPLDQPGPFLNQYSRFPQLVLNGDYPNLPLGLNFFISNEITHFDIRNDPGTTAPQPIGDRFHTQPGISLPLNWPFFFATPRIQIAATKYSIGDVTNNNPNNTGLALPIFDFNSGLYFDRDIHFFGHSLRQTLEPQLYYLYVPYHNQDEFPIFDTTVNTLTYDQLFTYNRFSGLDRIGDANQVSIGVATRFIDNDSGFEKIRAGIGEIIYFANRNVALCTNNEPNCPTPDFQTANTLRRSPITAVLSYNLSPQWSVTGNTIWNTQINEMDNQSIGVQYRKDADRIINVTYSFVRNGDVQPGLPINSNGNNLKQTDISFAWPVVHNWSAVGRWTQSINEAHFQNLLAGLQYDSCCWAIRAIAGKTFINLDANNTPQYNDEFYIQFALKGLGSFGPGGDPTQLLNSSINGYNANNFGQDF